MLVVVIVEPPDEDVDDGILGEEFDIVDEPLDCRLLVGVVGIAALEEDMAAVVEPHRPQYFLQYNWEAF